MGKAEDIVAGLGGADNIDEIEACATRLRTVVHDPSLVDEKQLRELHIRLRNPERAQEVAAGENGVGA